MIDAAPGNAPARTSCKDSQRLAQVAIFVPNCSSSAWLGFYLLYGQQNLQGWAVSFLWLLEPSHGPQHKQSHMLLLLLLLLKIKEVGF